MKSKISEKTKLKLHKAASIYAFSGMGLSMYMEALDKLKSDSSTTLDDIPWFKSSYEYYLKLDQKRRINEKI